MRNRCWSCLLFPKPFDWIVYSNNNQLESLSSKLYFQFNEQKNLNCSNNNCCMHQYPLINSHFLKCKTIKSSLVCTQLLTWQSVYLLNFGLDWIVYANNAIRGYWINRLIISIICLLVNGPKNFIYTVSHITEIS